jgi:hypothetical protein
MTHGKYCLAALSILMLLTSVAAASTKEQYDLQERCGKQAAELFNKDHGEAPGASFENHYSIALNKCFIVEQFLVVNGSSPSGYVIEFASDINDHKAFASFSGRFGFGNSDTPTVCQVNEKSCHSEAEWRELLKPYMEN